MCAAALAQLAQGASRPAGPAYLELLRRPELQSEQVREEKATFAAGCFWSVELAFQRLPGVLRTAVGYIGGKSESPSSMNMSSDAEVCTSKARNVEAIMFVVRAESTIGVCDDGAFNRCG